MVFFSAAPFKRDHYLTPLYPAAALLIARAWNLAIGRVSSAQALAWMRWSLGLILLVTLLGAPAYLELRSYARIKPSIGVAHWVIGEGKYGHRRLVVISNRPRPALSPGNGQEY